jgi:hypothetical protein
VGLLHGNSKYKSADQLEKKINEYFKICEKDNKHMTILSLCVHLGILRDTFSRYQEMEELSTIVKSAKQKIESYQESLLFNKNVPTAGVIFGLKNGYGWKDKIETENTNTNNNTNVDLDIKGKTVAEIQKMIDDLKKATQ